MSKDDFPAEEFVERQRRVRAKMAAEGIDLLLVFHPTNIQYMIGSRAKSYQEFQVLFFPLEEAPLTVFVRLAEVPELSDHSLAEDLRGWGGREPEDPVEAFAAILAQNVYGGNGRQFGLWSPAEERIGQDAVLVVARPSARAAVVARVCNRFERVEPPRRAAVVRAGRTVQEADFVICRGYRGPIAHE